MHNLRLILGEILLLASSAIAQVGAQLAEVTQIPAEIADPFTAFNETVATTAKADAEHTSDTKPAKRDAGGRVEIQDNYEAALKLATSESRPLLVILGADWCTWCRKLEEEFKPLDADAILKQWIVVKVDVDAEPDLAQELRANSLPGLRVLGTDQEIVASTEGYMPLVELHAWLDSSLPAADPTVQRVLFNSETIKESDLAKLIEFLGNRSPNLRNAAQRRLTGSRSVSASAVVDTLRTGRLSQQLCALNILQAWQAPVVDIDPWQPETIDAKSVQPLIEWLRDLPGSESEKPQAEIDAIQTDEHAKDIGIEILLSEDLKDDS